MQGLEQRMPKITYYEFLNYLKRGVACAKYENKILVQLKRINVLLILIN